MKPIHAKRPIFSTKITGDMQSLVSSYDETHICWKSQKVMTRGVLRCEVLMGMVYTQQRERVEKMVVLSGRGVRNAQ